MRFVLGKILVLFIFFVLVSCEANRQYTSRASKSITNPDSDLLEVNAAAYHVNDSSSVIFVEVVNENLIYKRPDTTAAFYAEVKVLYKLFSEQGSRKILDSSSVYLRDRADENVSVKSLKTMFSAKAKMGHDYFVEIQVYDLNKKVIYNKGLNVYKRNNFSAQNYLVNVDNQVPFTNRFYEGKQVSVQIKNTSVRQVTVDCFTKDFPPAATPFSLKPADAMKYTPDSTFILELKEGQFEVKMPPNGFYHIRSNDKSSDGLTLYTTSKTFPGVSNNHEMINCTRYLMNKDEFEYCLKSENQKEAIDNFWITIGGSHERAKELLKRYYGRVKEANKYYSSYTQGWKTDRGIIFIVFGPPTNIHRDGKSETWIYGMDSNPHAVRFQFSKTNNPFTDNDFVLQRSQFFKSSWYDAVDVWRQGHVYINMDK